MENKNEIINNEEIIETAVETTTKTDNSTGFKTMTKVGIVIFGGIIIYKFVAKPAIVKIKAKRKSDDIVSADDVIDIDDVIDETEDCDR